MEGINAGDVRAKNRKQVVIKCAHNPVVENMYNKTI
jgi:hypothetical protein